MTKKIVLLLIMLCAVTSSVTAQGFASLKRAKEMSPLYAAVKKTLSGEMGIKECRAAITDGDLLAPYNGCTPIYLVLDYLATHKKQDCSKAEEVLNAFLDRKDFDINLRYGELLPPFAYLIRKNRDFLNGNFSKDYLSDNVIHAFIEHGAKVNTYGNDGSNLITFAADTDNKELSSYLISKGINADKQDNHGKSEILKLVLAGKLDYVKQIFNEGQTALSVTDLVIYKSELDDVPETKAYLAKRLETLVRDYWPVMEYRDIFGKNSAIVNQRFEELALEQCNLCNCFSDVVRIDDSFPGSVNIEKKKRYYYDVQYVLAKDVLKDIMSHISNNTRTLEGESVVKEFDYITSLYDPDHLRSLSKMMIGYYAVVRGIELTPQDSYFSWSFPYHWNDENHPVIVRDAVLACKNNQGELSAYFAKVLPSLESKKETIDQRVAYAREQSRILREDHNRNRNAAIDYYKNTICKLTSSQISAMAGNPRWSRGRNFDTDEEYTDHKFFWLKDLKIEFTLDEVHSESQGIHFYDGPRGRYDFESDAIVKTFQELYYTKYIFLAWPELY